MSNDKGSGHEVLDGEQVVADEQNTDGSQTESETGEDTTPEKKNKSNFKKLSEAKKAAEIENKKLKEELLEVKEVINSFYEEWQEKPFKEKEVVAEENKIDKLEQRIFLNENPEAKEHLDNLNDIKSKYNMDNDDAWTFLKAKLPPESVSKKDISLKQSTPKVKKDLSKVTFEETWDLTPEERAEWRKLKEW